MKKIALILIIVLLYGCNYGNIDAIVRIGNSQIEEYCDENSLDKKYGITQIDKYQHGLVLIYSICEYNGKIHHVAYFFDRKGNILETSRMVDIVSEKE